MYQTCNHLGKMRRTMALGRSTCCLNTAGIATACMLLSSMMRARCRTLQLHGTSYIFYRELSMNLYAELYVGLFRTLYDNFGPYVEE